MNERVEPFGGRFALQWMVSVAAGAALGFLAAFMLMWSVVEGLQRTAGESAAALITGALFGAVVSIGANAGPAWLLAEKAIPARRWLGASVLTTALSTAVAFVLAWPAFEAMPELAAIAFVGVMLGLPQGLVQSLLLRGQSSQPLVWTLISTAGYLVAVTALMLLSGEERGWMAVGSSGLLLGGSTALGIMWLMRERPFALAA